MPRSSDETNQRVQLQMSAARKARIYRAAATQQMNVSTFVSNAAVRAANAVIEREERIERTEREHQRMMELLENPLRSNAKT